MLQRFTLTSRMRLMECVLLWDELKVRVCNCSIRSGPILSAFQGQSSIICHTGDTDEALCSDMQTHPCTPGLFFLFSNKDQMQCWKANPNKPSTNWTPIGHVKPPRKGTSRHLFLFTVFYTHCNKSLCQNVITVNPSQKLAGAAAQAFNLFPIWPSPNGLMIKGHKMVRVKPEGSASSVDCVTSPFLNGVRERLCVSVGPDNWFQFPREQEFHQNTKCSKKKFFNFNNFFFTICSAFSSVLMPSLSTVMDTSLA